MALLISTNGVEYSLTKEDGFVRAVMIQEDGFVGRLFEVANHINASTGAVSVAVQNGTKVKSYKDWQWKHLIRVYIKGSRYPKGRRKSSPIRDYSPIMTPEEGVVYYTRIHPATWVYIEKYDVFCSDDGLIASRKKGIGILKANSYIHGYYKFRNTTGHRVIWEAFNGPIPENVEINHINEVRNDNRLENLELLSHNDNIRYRDREGQKRDISGVNHPRCKKVGQYTKDGQLIKIWDYESQAAVETNIWQSSICNCVNGKCKTAGGYVWKKIEE